MTDFVPQLLSRLKLTKDVPLRDRFVVVTSLSGGLCILYVVFIQPSAFTEGFHLFLYVALLIQTSAYLSIVIFNRSKLGVYLLALNCALYAFSEWYFMGGVKGSLFLAIYGINILMFNLLDSREQIYFFIFSTLFVGVLLWLEKNAVFTIAPVDVSLNTRIIQTVSIVFVSSMGIILFRSKDHDRLLDLRKLEEQQSQLIKSTEREVFLATVRNRFTITYLTESVFKIFPEVELHEISPYVVDLITEDGQHPSVSKVELHGYTKFLKISQQTVYEGKERVDHLIVKDVTEHYTFEDQLKEAIRKEQVLKKNKNEFVTMVSHQFRTPLTTIKSANELLSYALQEEEPTLYEEKITPKIQQVTDSVNTLTKMIEQLLDFGKIESDVVSLHYTEIDMASFIQSFIKEQEIVLNRAIQFEILGYPKHVEVDKQMISTILSNLCSNACKYSEATQPVFVGLEYGKDDFVIEVQDFGKGIDSEILPNLFQYLPSTELHQGMGIGLFIVRQFVEMHGGNITVRSERARGTTFSINLPNKKP